MRASITRRSRREFYIRRRARWDENTPLFYNQAPISIYESDLSQ